MRPPSLNMTLAEVLRDFPEQGRIWEELVMNPGQHHSQSLSEACGELGLHASTVLRLLSALQAAQSSRSILILELLSLNELCDHVAREQQERLLAGLSGLDRWVDRTLPEGDGTNPQISAFKAEFESFRSNITRHVHREVTGLFPVIRRLGTGDRGDTPPAGEIRSLVQESEQEHLRLDESLAELTSFAASETWRGPSAAQAEGFVSAVAALNQVLQEQIYTENSVLFPRIQETVVAL